MQLRFRRLNKTHWVTSGRLRYSRTSTGVPHPRRISSSATIVHRRHRCHGRRHTRSHTIVSDRYCLRLIQYPRLTRSSNRVRPPSIVRLSNRVRLRSTARSSRRALCRRIVRSSRRIRFRRPTRSSRRGLRLNNDRRRRHRVLKRKTQNPLHSGPKRDSTDHCRRGASACSARAGSMFASSLSTASAANVTNLDSPGASCRSPAKCCHASCSH
jgi:hypothetical protein